jgi:hypothetical protein
VNEREKEVTRKEGPEFIQKIESQRDQSFGSKRRVEEKKEGVTPENEKKISQNIESLLPSK